VVEPGDEAAFVATFRLADLPGVGPKFQEQLARIGWHDVRDVISHDRAVLERVAGVRRGRWLYDMVRGIDDSDVRGRAASKSIGHETTFARDVMSDAELRRTLLVLTDGAVADLRQGGLAARTITVRLKDADFVLRRASRTVPTALTTYQAAAPIVGKLLQRLRDARRVPARLVGVTLSQLAHAARADQLALFESAAEEVETSKQRRVAAAVDRLRSRLGHDVIGFGPAGVVGRD